MSVVDPLAAGRRGIAELEIYRFFIHASHRRLQGNHRQLAMIAKETGSRCPSTCGQFFYGFGRQRLAANTPLAAVDFENLYPCYAAHVFTFDLNHRVGQLLNNLLFLLGIEHTLDQMDIDLWHCSCLLCASSLKARNARNMRNVPGEVFQTAIIFCLENPEMPFISIGEGSATA